MSTNEIDHPRLRQFRMCICCGAGKDAGLLICWGCHKDLKAQHDGGYGQDVETRLDAAEATLCKIAEALASASR